MDKTHDVVGEWASRLTTEELQAKIRYLSVVVQPYDRGEQEVVAYKIRKLRQELETRKDA